MKKFLFMIGILFIFILSVNADTFSISKVNDVINNGDITSEYIKKLGDDCNTKINSVLNGDDTLTISYDITCKVKKDDQEIEEKDSNTFTFKLDNQSNILVFESTEKEDLLEEHIYYEDVLKLVPYWGAEASSKWDEMKKYMTTGSYISKLSEIFDRCHMEEFGVCYSKIPGYQKIEYVARIQLDDTAGTYALKKLKEEKKKLEQKELNKKLFIVAGILLVAIIFCKSMAGPNKKMKY